MSDIIWAALILGICFVAGMAVFGTYLVEVADSLKFKGEGYQDEDPEPHEAQVG